MISKKNQDILVIVLMALLYLGVQVNVILFDIQLRELHKSQKIVIVKDTIHIVDTVVVYRDTCDSHFMKTIGEIETGLKTFSEQNPDYYSVKIDGENKRGKGHFGIYEICVKGTGFHKSLGYTHDDMYNFEKSVHVFWAMMGIQAYRFRRKHNRNPTYEELARMWAGGFTSYNTNNTVAYATKFRKVWQK
jgi:hypothetical protein